VRNEYREILIESWKYCQKEKDLEIYAWCIMTSHVHMIIGSRGRDLDKIVGEMKSFTSRSLRKEITNNSTFIMQSFSKMSCTQRKGENYKGCY
jgi:REP element-mobilizing transposase RayT